MRSARLACMTLAFLLSVSLLIPTLPAEASVGKLTGLRISPANAIVVVGSTVTFTATPLDEAGSVVADALITWELRDRTGAVGALESAGAQVTFTAGSQGAATVYARASAGVSSVVGLATVVIADNPISNYSARYPPSSILGFPSDALGLAPGQSIAFQAQGYGPDGRPLATSEADYLWRMRFSLGDVGTIATDGRFTAGTRGFGILQVSGAGPALGLDGAATVSTAGPDLNPLPHVEVTPGVLSLLRAGSTFDFDARLVVAGKSVQAEFTWSLPMLVWEAGSISPATGKFSAHRAGAALLEATTSHEGKNLSGFAIVTVSWGRPTLFGRITNVDGVPVSGATVTARTIGGAETGATTTDAHGAYSVAASPGELTTITSDSSGSSTRIVATPTGDESENRYDITVAGVIAGPPGAAQTWPYLFAGFGVVVTGTLAVALLLGGEAAFVAMLLIFMPLYARIKAEKMLDHFVRGRIFGLIQAQPGLSYSGLRRLTGVGNGTLGYHLWCLEKTEYIFSRREGKLKAYYPKGFNAPDRGRMLSDPQQRIMEVVQAQPGVSQSDVARALGTTRQHVNFNVKHMERLGLLRIVRESGEARCHPIEDSPQSPQPRPEALARTTRAVGTEPAVPGRP